MMETELRGDFLINVQYIFQQQHINPHMREILVDWILLVSKQFSLAPETIHISVNIIDRYMMRRMVTKDQLQLVGVTALFIAVNYEEVNPPTITDLVYMTDNAFDAGDILRMQTYILTELEFSFTFPTALSFLETYMKFINVFDLPTELYTRFLIEMSLVYIHMQKFTPSTIALAALLVTARRM
jgi:acyl-ACP thioesterase